MELFPSCANNNVEASPFIIDYQWSEMMDVESGEVTTSKPEPAFRFGARDPTMFDSDMERSRDPPTPPTSMIADDMIIDQSEYDSAPPEKSEIDILEIDEFQKKLTKDHRIFSSNICNSPSTYPLKFDQFIKEEEAADPGKWFQTARILQRLEKELPSKYGAREYYSENLVKIHDEVKRARVLFLESKGIAVPQQVDRNTMRERYKRSRSATVRAWADDQTTGSYIGHDVTFVPSGRGAADTKILSIDPGERVFVTAVDEKGNAYQFGKQLAAFMNYANHQIAARQHFIDTELEKDPRVQAKRRYLKYLESSLQGNEKEEIEWDWIKNELGAYDRPIGRRERWDWIRKEMDECVREISQLKADIETNDSKYVKLKNYRKEINDLHEVMRVKKIRLQDEISNFCCTFDLVIIPKFDTKGITSRNRNKGLCKRAKTNLNRFSHEELLKLIRQKVEAVGGQVLVTSEAYTTKTCSCCGHQQYVGTAKIFSCKNKCCGAVMDRDVNAAVNIMRDTLLRVVRHTRQKNLATFSAAEEYLLSQTSIVQKDFCKTSTVSTIGSYHFVLGTDARHPISNPAIWQETAVSSILRSILDDNDEPDGNDGQPLLGLRKLDPLPTLAMERRFLDMARQEFWKGWQLGTEPEVQVATYFSNHLTNGIMKYFSECGRLEEAAKFFEPLFEKDPEVGAVLAKAYLGIVQIDFLVSKKKLDMALKLAKLAVTYAPSEYTTWSKLTEVYIEIGDFESQVTEFSEKDAQRMPPPIRTHLPLKPDPATLKADEDPKKMPPMSGTIYDENDPRENEIHPELLRLPALSLRGTFSKAYALLIRIVSKVGWDELLRFRSNVFVMEEEYRIHRAVVEEKSKAEFGDEEENVNAEEDTQREKQKAPEKKEDDGFQTIALDNMNDVALDDNIKDLVEPSSSVPDDAKSPAGTKGVSIDEIMKKAAAEQVESVEGTRGATRIPTEAFLGIVFFPE
ncbi:hypothetical protein HDU96_009714 [Phlyctochytrium bullatum]|nr:hypothetical protein HDU96_009714 [Phlyctochytrium bullatum]